MMTLYNGDMWYEKMKDAFLPKGTDADDDTPEQYAGDD